MKGTWISPLSFRASLLFSRIPQQGFLLMSTDSSVQVLYKPFTMTFFVNGRKVSDWLGIQILEADSLGSNLNSATD